MTTGTEIFLLGALGTAAPEIVRHVSIARNGDEFTWSWYLLIASLVYALLGGVLAYILPSANALAALYNGASTDVLINRAIAKAGGSDKRRAKRTAIRKAVGAEHASAPRLSVLDSFIAAL